MDLPENPTIESLKKYQDHIKYCEEKWADHLRGLKGNERRITAVLLENQATVQECEGFGDNSDL